ncbi:MAG: aconitate hydratase, partial [Myxococcales bacterium]
SIADRATIGNMSPEYGATCGFFPVDDDTIRYLSDTGRPAAQVALVEAYAKAQGMYRTKSTPEPIFTDVLKLELAQVEPSVAGPKRPQDRVALKDVKSGFAVAMEQEFNKGGETGAETFDLHPSLSTSLDKSFSKAGPPKRIPVPGRNHDLGHGDVVIAAITSCTNTSNPNVMLAAGLLAKKAVAKGLAVKPTVKTSLAPGSRVVTDYLEKTGLLAPLAALGFDVVGYGCTTCIGNSGPLDARIEGVVSKHELVCAAVLSGNRNFEARIHQAIKANFLMSPPLVVAFAIAGNVAIDLSREPLGTGKDGKAVYLRDVWPTEAEVQAVLEAASDPAVYRKNYQDVQTQNAAWNALPAPTGETYTWDPQSTYVREPPYFIPFSMKPGQPAGVRGARALAIFGDSVTTDHISPAGSIKPSAPAGVYLQQLGVPVADFNSYGARRGNHEVMVRGTFANVRIKNLMVSGVEGGVTLLQPEGKRTSIHDASLEYQKRGIPLMVFAGHEYGTGSSRDWAAKGTALLGVKAVVAKSFERIHRSNLVMMGVLPCQFEEGTDAQTLRLTGNETYDLLGISAGVAPRQKARLVIHRADGKQDEAQVIVRIDTPIEVEYYKGGGILPYVLRQIMSQAG